MRKLLLTLAGFAIAVTPLTSVQAENINIYGWQNWSYEWVDADGGKDFDRLSNNAANIGFMSHMDTGIPGLQVGLRCEQFTYWGRLNNYTGWCNRNSKISLRHETMGEIMFGQWLLPFNEIVAQWIDPFYDAGADSHTSIMGNLGVGGLESLFYNGSFNHPTDFTSAFGVLAFNRRQEGVIQYVWPNTGAMASQSRDGFQFRFAMTEGSATDTPTDRGTQDPRIWSTGISWQQNLANGGQIWLAAAYEQHDDLWSNGQLNAELLCEESNDDARRIAGRYVHDWGNGMKTQLGVMWEELDYEADVCTVPAGTIIGQFQTTELTGQDIGIEREAWMVSGKHVFGNGFDFRFSYMEADDWDCDNTDSCEREVEKNTEADAYNVGLFYTMPKGTELRATWSEVDNDSGSAYDFGINGGGVQGGQDVEMFAIGIVHWFD